MWAELSKGVRQLGIWNFPVHNLGTKQKSPHAALVSLSLTGWILNFKRQKSKATIQPPTHPKNKSQEVNAPCPQSGYSWFFSPKMSPNLTPICPAPGWIYSGTKPAFRTSHLLFGQHHWWGKCREKCPHISKVLRRVEKGLQGTWPHPYHFLPVQALFLEHTFPTSSLQLSLAPSLFLDIILTFCLQLKSIKHFQNPHDDKHGYWANIQQFFLGPCY